MGARLALAQSPCARVVRALAHSGFRPSFFLILLYIGFSLSPFLYQSHFAAGQKKNYSRFMFCHFSLYFFPSSDKE